MDRETKKYKCKKTHCSFLYMIILKSYLIISNLSLERDVFVKNIILEGTNSDAQRQRIKQI